MMTKKEQLELATLIAEAVVKAMKAETAPPTSANEGKKTKTATKSRKSATPNEPKKTENAKYSTKIADYEPKKVDGFYKWGRKTDTIKSRNYRAMQIAYCYAVATKGQAISSDECFNLGLEIDYSENGAYAKAKAKFHEKFVYIKKADR